MKRPLGITFLCLALGWLAIAGVGNGVFIFSGQFGGMPIYLGLFAVAYAITAFLAAVNLWRMKEWGVYVLRGWMIVCLAMFMTMLPTLGHIALGGTLGLVGFAVVVVLMFWLLNGYVTKRVRVVA